MKTLLNLEELAQLAFCILALNLWQPYEFAWWAWPLLFLAPDLSIAGYAAGPKAGAFFYNLGHHKGVAAAFIAGGWLWCAPPFLLAGLLLYAHSAFDRALGYGLKHTDSFRHTHLGMIGTQARA